MGYTRRRSELGLTMIEVAISSFILAMLVGMASWLVWSSAKHVSTSEARMQMDMESREFLATITKELRQTRLGQVHAVDTATIPLLDATTLTALATPGSASPLPTAGTAFYGIRFKIPGKSMDLTNNNVGSFDLPAYVADKSRTEPLNPDWTTEIQYWWEPDAQQKEGAPGAWAENNAPDGVDNNKNGVTDEGVIKRMETTFDTSGNLVTRTVSIVCHDVQLAGPPAAPPLGWTIGKAKVGLTFVVLPGVDLNGVPQQVNRVQVTVTMERQDPQNSKQTIWKQVSSLTEMRNRNK
jgi:hypothetical protein